MVYNVGEEQNGLYTCICIIQNKSIILSGLSFQAKSIFTRLVLLTLLHYVHNIQSCHHIHVQQGDKSPIYILTLQQHAIFFLVYLKVSTFSSKDEIAFRYDYCRVKLMFVCTMSALQKSCVYLRILNRVELSIHFSHYLCTFPRYPNPPWYCYRFQARQVV